MSFKVFDCLETCFWKFDFTIRAHRGNISTFGVVVYTQPFPPTCHSELSEESASLQPVETVLSTGRDVAAVVLQRRKVLRWPAMPCCLFVGVGILDQRGLRESSSQKRQPGGQ